MGIMDWFKGIVAGKDQGTATPVADRAAEVEGLNFMTAIDAHMKWKTRLESYIQGSSDEDLRLDAVARDDQCALGKWIHGPGSERFGANATFSEMRKQHAHFHSCAGEVLGTAQAGDRDGAMRKLSQGDYVKASERVKMLLAKLYVQVSEGREN